MSLENYVQRKENVENLKCFNAQEYRKKYYKTLIETVYWQVKKDYQQINIITENDLTLSTMQIDMSIAEMQIKALLDTGASCSIMD